ncbi:MAG: oligosaccharide flippase family protein [Bacteroidales bacterium]
MSFKKLFFKNISHFAFFSYISQALEFLSTIILSRLLLPEEYGFVALITIFSGFIQLFSNVGIGTSVVRSDYGYTFHRYLYNLSIWMGVLFMLVLMLMAYPISYFFNDKALILPTIVISVKFFFDAFTYIPYAVLSKELKFGHIGTAKLAGAIFQIALTIAMAYAGFSYWSLIVPLVFSPILQFLYLRKKVNVRLKLMGVRSAWFAFEKIKSLMGNLSLNNLISYWAGNTDKLVIGKMYSQADLGLYNRAFRFIMISSRLLTGIFSTVLFPSLKDLMTKKGDVHKEYLDILRIITLFNMPVVVVLMLFADPLVLILWGQDWMGVAPFLPYVGIILIYHSILSTMHSVFMLYVKERNLLYINTANTFLTIIFVLIGAMFSMNHILQFLTLGMILVTMPINIYFGFYKSFGYAPKGLFRFWTPMILGGLAMFAGAYTENFMLSSLSMAALTVLLLAGMRSTLTQGYLWVKERFL